MLNEILREVINGFLPNQFREALENAANHTVLSGARSYYKYTETFGKPDEAQNLAADYVALARYDVATCSAALKTLTGNLRSGAFAATTVSYFARYPACALAIGWFAILPIFVKPERVRADIIEEYYPKMSKAEQWHFSLRTTTLKRNKIAGESETESTSRLKSVLPADMPVIRTKSIALYNRG